MQLPDTPRRAARAYTGRDKYLTGSFTNRAAGNGQHVVALQGADVSLSGLTGKATWTDLGFSDAVWDYSTVSRGYPRLKGLGGQ